MFIEITKNELWGMLLLICVVSSLMSSGLIVFVQDVKKVVKK